MFLVAYGLLICVFAQWFYDLFGLSESIVFLRFLLNSMSNFCLSLCRDIWSRCTLMVYLYEYFLMILSSLLKDGELGFLDVEFILEVFRISLLRFNTLLFMHTKTYDLRLRVNMFLRIFWDIVRVDRAHVNILGCKNANYLI